MKLDQIPAAIRPKSFHNFRNHDGSAAITQRFTSAAFNQLGFQWDEPFLLGKVKTDFNVYVFDENGNWMDPFSAAFPGFYTTDNNVLSDEPFEFIVLPPFPGEVHGGRNQSDYQIVIGNVNGRRDRPTFDEDGQRGQHLLFRVVEQRDAPFGGRAQRALTLGKVDRAGTQGVEALCEPSEQCIWFQQADAGRRELDRKRQTVEPPADPGHGQRVVVGQGKVVADGPGTIDEQLHGG